ncbi:MAG TPA: molybdate ABC transporter substrate-binding protein, partial [Dehalococcoidia bacterium]|nr:molybdate ABC transporter substrate-binding protein [Dehalococcoidia bacterium]
MRRLWGSSVAVLLGVVAVLAFACGDDAGPDPTPAAPSSPQLSGKVTVFAAASLTDAFNEIAKEFKKRNSQTEIEFNFAGSPALRTQLQQGARADIYASADQPNMTQALTAGLVQGAGRVFVKNSLVIITPRDNPGRISAPADLRKSGLKLVFAAPEVAVGNYARQALGLMEKEAAFGAGFSDAVLKSIVSNESNAKQVVAKVELGEADGGIVYGTDVTPSVAPKLATVQIPTQINVIAEYPIALTKKPRNAAVAQAFVAFVTGSDGQAI